MLNGYSCQLHLSESLFHATFMVIPLNDCILKKDFLKFGHFQSDIPRSGDEATVMVATAAAITCSLHSYRAAYEDLSSFRYRCKIGLRKSQSIKSTQLPASANDTAKLIATLLFPSPGIALVITIFLHYLPIARNFKFVRRLLNAS